MKTPLKYLLLLPALTSSAVYAQSKIQPPKPTILTIDCSDNKQKACVTAEITPFDASFTTCPNGRATDPITLETFADKKFPPPLNSTAQKLRSTWITSVYDTCSSQIPQYNPKESSSWTNQFMVGYSLNSDYDENNEHKGLTANSPFAQFGFDGRWVTDNDTLIHWEIGGLFASSPALNQKEPATSTTEPDPETPNNEGGDETPSDETPKSNKPTFNDVTDSLDIYTKVTFNSWRKNDDKPLKDYFTAGALAGFKTRDNITDENDAVIYYYGVLGEYLYFGKDMHKNPNTIPRGKVWLGYLNFEEYGGQENQKRFLIRGEWQLNPAEDANPEDGRFVVGIKANLGEGADDVGIFFAYRSGFDSIRSFITGN